MHARRASPCTSVCFTVTASVVPLVFCFWYIVFNCPHREFLEFKNCPHFYCLQNKHLLTPSCQVFSLSGALLSARRLARRGGGVCLICHVLTGWAKHSGLQLNPCFSIFPHVYPLTPHPRVYFLTRLCHPNNRLQICSSSNRCGNCHGAGSPWQHPIPILFLKDVGWFDCWKHKD